MCLNYEVHCRCWGCATHLYRSVHKHGHMWNNDDNSSQLSLTRSLELHKNERITGDTCLLNYSMNELCYRIYWIGASHTETAMSRCTSRRHTLFRFGWYTWNGLCTTVSLSFWFDRNHSHTHRYSAKWYTLIKAKNKPRKWKTNVENDGIRHYIWDVAAPSVRFILLRDIVRMFRIKCNAHTVCRLDFLEQ